VNFHTLTADAPRVYVIFTHQEYARGSRLRTALMTSGGGSSLSSGGKSGTSSGSSGGGGGGYSSGGIRRGGGRGRRPKSSGGQEVRGRHGAQAGGRDDINQLRVGSSQGRPRGESVDDEFLGEGGGGAPQATYGATDDNGNDAVFAFRALSPYGRYVAEQLGKPFYGRSQIERHGLRYEERRVGVGCGEGGGGKRRERGGGGRVLLLFHSTVGKEGESHCGQALVSLIFTFYIAHLSVIPTLVTPRCRWTRRQLLSQVGISLGRRC
jgi:hypothetical protein